MTAPAGCISLAQDNLRITLADCATFRTWVGASGASAQTQARKRVHDDALPPPKNGDAYKLAELNGLRPYALIGTLGFLKDADSMGPSGSAMIESGRMGLTLADTIPTSLLRNPGEIGRRFLNKVGQVLDEMETLAGTGGYLAVSTIEMDEGYYLITQEEAIAEGDAIAVDLIVTWGERG